MSKGTVKWFNDAKGYGFILTSDTDEEVFVHYSSIQAEGFKSLTAGEEVEFELVTGEKGPKAEKVSRIQPQQ